MKNLAAYDVKGTLDQSFWNHIYNIGGGESCRVSAYEMYKESFGKLGITNPDYIFSPKEQAIRNFHGHFYEDSDKLENYLHFRQDSIQYFYDSYVKGLGAVVPIFRFISKLPDKLSDMVHFKDWKHVIHLNHGYDETKPEEELNLEDMKKAAKFRGGSCDSETMNKGDWSTPLMFTCQFGHHFKGSPRLILEGGHWCDECERKSWNYGVRAKKDQFFAQVWNPLHEEGELREYPKDVSELDVE